MKEIYNKDFQCEISQEEADKIREEMRKAPVIEMKVKNEDEVEFTMLQVKSYEVKEFLDKLQKEYIPTSKIKAKIEELEIEQESNREDLKIAIDNLLFQNIDKIGNEISINMSVRGILQSLLEKE